MNNAGVGIVPKADLSDLRDVYNTVLNTNVTSVALCMSHFLSLMRKSADPRIINVSSARGSLSLSTTQGFPPSVSIPYGVSKTALNMLTVEYMKDPLNKDVSIYSTSPGHCKTAFNGYRGTKDPLDGAKVVVQLAFAEKGQYQNGFYQVEGDETEPTAVPW